MTDCTEQTDWLVVLPDFSTYVQRCGTPHLESWQLISGGVTLFLTFLGLVEAHFTGSGQTCPEQVSGLVLSPRAPRPWCFLPYLSRSCE